MYIAIGKETKKIYATGGQAECYQILQHTYPYYTEGRNNMREHTVQQLMPEPMIIRRRVENDWRIATYVSQNCIRVYG